MAKRRRKIKDWWIEDVKAPWLGRGEISFETDKEIFVLVIDDYADLMSYLDNARTIHRRWLEELMGVQALLAPEKRATVTEEGE